MTSDIHDTLVNLTSSEQTYWLGLKGKKVPVCKEDFTWHYYNLPIKNTSFHAWDDINISTPAYSCGALFNGVWVAVSCFQYLSAFICEQGNQYQTIITPVDNYIHMNGCVIPSSSTNSNNQGK